MQLAADDIVIGHGLQRARLTPSLRAAIRLHRKHGLRKLATGLHEGNISIIADILAEADDPDTARTVLERKMQEHLGNAIEELRDPLTEFLLISFGFHADEDHPAEKPTRADKPFDMAKHLAGLFEIGTGWLGWSPADTWNATPAEIAAAQRGLIAKLKAIHGTAEGDKPAYDPREEVSPEEARAGIAKLKLGAKRKVVR